MEPKAIRFMIAETAPIIRLGILESLKQFYDLPKKIIEVDSRESLFDCIASENIDILLLNPSFDGILNPEDIRKSSLNPEVKIYAIALGDLSKSLRPLYDDYINVSDDITDIRKKFTNLIIKDKEQSEDKDTLSSREKEIISFVVKGFTNQEIADKLFLSIHTVMTHRKNIARKLQIHSATGLTIYAIVNKIVDLRDIKL